MAKNKNVIDASSENSKIEQRKSVKTYITHTKTSFLILAVLIIGLLCGFAAGKISSKQQGTERGNDSSIRDGSQRQRGGPGQRVMPQDQ